MPAVGLGDKMISMLDHDNIHGDDDDKLDFLLNMDRPYIQPAGDSAAAV